MKKVCESSITYGRRVSCIHSHIEKIKALDGVGPRRVTTTIAPPMSLMMMKYSVGDHPFIYDIFSNSHRN